MSSDLMDFHVGELPGEVAVLVGLGDAWVEALVVVAALYACLGLARLSFTPSFQFIGRGVKEIASRKALGWCNGQRREGMEITTATFNSILYIAVRELASAAQLRELVDYMQSAPITPDATTYSILIGASCDIGQLDVAMLLFKELRTRCLRLDEALANVLLNDCAEAGKIAQVEQILEEMRSMELTPTHETICVLVSMYGKAKVLDKAIGVSRMAEEEFGIRPNLHVYTTLIQACVWNSQLRASWEIFGSMLQAGVLPDAVAYRSLIHGCIYQSKLEQAMDLVRHAYALPTPAGRRPLESLGLAFRLRQDGTMVCAPAQQQERAVQLQPDVLGALRAALRRKSLERWAAELELIGNFDSGASTGRCRVQTW